MINNLGIYGATGLSATRIPLLGTTRVSALCLPVNGSAALAGLGGVGNDTINIGGTPGPAGPPGPPGPPGPVGLVPVTLITAAETPYTALLTDYYIGVASLIPITINLPPGINGSAYIIKDELGLGSGAITIVPNGTETIEGIASYISAIPLASITFIFSGTNWNAV